MTKIYTTILLFIITFYLWTKSKEKEIISIKKNIFFVIFSTITLYYIIQTENNIYNNLSCCLWCILYIIINYFCVLNFGKIIEKANKEIEEIEKTITV